MSQLPGSRYCSSPSCRKPMVFLANRYPEARSPWIPVDASSLSAEEQERLRAGESIDYDRDRHVSHYRTCSDPNRFSRHKPKKKEPSRP